MDLGRRGAVRGEPRVQDDDNRRPLPRSSGEWSAIRPRVREPAHHFFDI
jgi:hypothetical protein